MGWSSKKGPLQKEAESSSSPIIFQWANCYCSFEGGKSPSENPLLKILGNEALCESVEFWTQQDKKILAS